MCAAHQRDSRRRPHTPGPGTAAEPGRTHLLALPEPLLLTDCGPRACARLVHQAPGSPCGRRRASAPCRGSAMPASDPSPTHRPKSNRMPRYFARYPDRWVVFSYSPVAPCDFLHALPKPETLAHNPRLLLGAPASARPPLRRDVRAIVARPLPIPIARGTSFRIPHWLTLLAKRVIQYHYLIYRKVGRSQRLRPSVNRSLSGETDTAKCRGSRLRSMAERTTSRSVAYLEVQPP